MKRKAILVVAIMMIMPGAHAAGIRSAAGQSQSAWNASTEYQNFQCPAGTSRGEGVDMNFTTDRSDDYYFVECNPIVVSTPAPVIQPTITPETSTVITRTDTPTVVSTGTTTGTTTTTSTTPVSVTAFDWNSFMDQFNAWFGSWFTNWFNAFFAKWLGL